MGTWASIILIVALAASLAVLVGMCQRTYRQMVDERDRLRARVLRDAVRLRAMQAAQRRRELQAASLVPGSDGRLQLKTWGKRLADRPQRLSAAIDTLDMPAKRVAQLALLRGQSVGEIAEHMRASEDSVIALWRNLVPKLEERLA